jgi:hypothetical protein
LIAARAAAIHSGASIICGGVKTSEESGTGIHYIDVIYCYCPSDAPVTYTLTVHQGSLAGL